MSSKKVTFANDNERLLRAYDGQRKVKRRAEKINGQLTRLRSMLRREQQRTHEAQFAADHWRRRFWDVYEELNFYKQFEEVTEETDDQTTINDSSFL